MLEKLNENNIKMLAKAFLSLETVEEFSNLLEDLCTISEIKAMAQRIEVAQMLCDRVVYKDDNVAGINRVFTETPPVNGLCGTYANAFVYLCQRANIPCISVKDSVEYNPLNER